MGTALSLALVWLPSVLLTAGAVWWLWPRRRPTCHAEPLDAQAPPPRARATRSSGTPLDDEGDEVLTRRTRR